MREHFTDDVLDGLLPVLRHNAAKGLWQLAVAVSCTRPELAIQDAAELLRARSPGTLRPHERRLLLISEQLDEEVSWHASFRFGAARPTTGTALVDSISVMVSNFDSPQKALGGRSSFSAIVRYRC